MIEVIKEIREKEIEEGKEKRNVPELRFKGFDDEWGEKKLGNFICEIVEKTSDRTKYPLYSLTIENGVVPKSDRYERDFLVKDDSNFKIVYKNDFVYNPMNLRFGALAIYNGECPISVSGYYNIFRFNDSKVCNFWINYLKRERMMYLYNTIATGSLEEKKRVHYSQFKELNLKIPSIQEQEKIAQFFTIIDKKIEKQSEKVEALKTYKKGMMQKIFKQEIRFRDENGEEYSEWEEKKLGEVIQLKSVRNLNNYVNLVLSVSNSKGFICQAEQFEDRIVASSNVSNYKVVNKDDFAFNPSRINVGSIARLKHFEQGIVSPMYICFRCKSIMKSDFLEVFLDTYYFKIQVKNKLEGSVRQSLSSDSLCIIKINLPCLKEQTKIANFFTTIDKKIEKENKKLEELKNWKKGLLQKMFV